MELNKPLRLLPGVFKKIGVFMIFLVAAIFLYVVIIRPAATQQTKEITKAALFSGFTLGLFFIAISRDKIEDELTQVIRLKAMALAFITGIVLGIIYPFVSFLFHEPLEFSKGNELIMNMLLTYFLVFSFLKFMR